MNATWFNLSGTNCWQQLKPQFLWQMQTKGTRKTVVEDGKPFFSLYILECIILGLFNSFLDHYLSSTSPSHRWSHKRNIEYYFWSMENRAQVHSSPSHFIWAHARIAIKLFSELSILDLLFFPSSYREHNYMSIWITKYYYSWNNRFYSHVHEWNVIMTTSAGLIQFICSASREVWSRCLI